MGHLTTTTELLTELRRGTGEPAWNLFVDRHRPVLVGVARQLGLGDEDAQDAAQQTLLEFVRDFGLGRYDRNRSRLRTWLLGILRHRVVDLQRLRGRRAPGAALRSPGSQSGSELDGLSDPQSDEAVDRLWQEEVDRRILAEAIEGLRSDKHLEERSLRAFELTVLRGMPIDVAAAACDMTVNAVYIARSRITGRLRRQIALRAPAYEETFDL